MATTPTQHPATAETSRAVELYADPMAASTSPGTPPQERRCRATSRSGQQCKRYAIRGANVCRWHGGAAPQVQAAAARRVQQEELETMARRASADGPTVTMSEVYTEMLTTAGMLIEYRDELADRKAAVTSWRSTDARGTEQLNAIIGLYEGALHRTVATLERIARLDIEGRKVRLSELEVRRVLGAVERSLGAGDLSPAQLSAIRAEMAVQARALQGLGEGS
ncbi:MULTISPECIES: HGGxSTG domain-containing protein [Arsenicicoccus]|uniref:HGGxSTG domain-containing protein n=1 Tax=Arsenicicoccus TaxID=267408 RepID=UPI00258047A8|nr:MULTISPECIES: HGGxSTG domain-containing protein [Arsenicicoccus]